MGSGIANNRYTPVLALLLVVLSCTLSPILFGKGNFSFGQGAIVLISTYLGTRALAPILLGSLFVSLLYYPLHSFSAVFLLSFTLANLFIFTLAQLVTRTLNKRKHRPVLYLRWLTYALIPSLLIGLPLGFLLSYTQTPGSALYYAASLFLSCLLFLPLDSIFPKKWKQVQWRPLLTGVWLLQLPVIASVFVSPWLSCAFAPILLALVSRHLWIGQLIFQISIPVLLVLYSLVVQAAGLEVLLLLTTGVLLGQHLALSYTLTRRQLSDDEKKIALLENALSQTQSNLERLKQTDPLTGAINKRYWQELARHTLERAQRYKEPFAVLAIDIIQFKQIRLTYGQHGADSALLHLVTVCRKLTRSSDILARIENDRFVILLPRTQLLSAQMVTRKIHQQLANSPLFSSLDTPYKLQVKIGVAEWRGDESRVQQTLKRAFEQLETKQKQPADGAKTSSSAEGVPQA